MNTWQRFKDWLRPFLKGAGTVLEICPPDHPSYDKQFGTDEELLKEDWEKIQKDIYGIRD